MGCEGVGDVLYDAGIYGLCAMRSCKQSHNADKIRMLIRITMERATHSIRVSDRTLIFDIYIFEDEADAFGFQH
jgi:hypothetical protein